MNLAKIILVNIVAESVGYYKFYNCHAILVLKFHSGL